MSHLSTIKSQTFASKLEAAKANPGFQSRQAAYLAEVEEANAGLTALLAIRHKAGETLTEADLAQYPIPGESPADALARQIHMGMQQ